MKLIGQDLNAFAHLVTSVSENEHLLRRLLFDLEVEEASQIRCARRIDPPPDALPFTHSDPYRTSPTDGTPDP